MKTIILLQMIIIPLFTHFTSYAVNTYNLSPNYIFNKTTYTTYPDLDEIEDLDLSAAAHDLKTAFVVLEGFINVIISKSDKYNLDEVDENYIKIYYASIEILLKDLNTALETANFKDLKPKLIELLPFVKESSNIFKKMLSKYSQQEIVYLKLEKILDSTISIIDMIEFFNRGYRFNSMDRSKLISTIKNLMRYKVPDILDKYRQENDITFDFTLPENMNGSPDVFFNTSVFKEIVKEIITNAAKYSNTKKIHVDFSISHNQIVCNIRDFGKGLSNDDLYKSFLIGHTESTDGRGTGWGLPMLERRIHSLGGRLAVVSKKAGEDAGCYGDIALIRQNGTSFQESSKDSALGTQFTFTFPINHIDAKNNTQEIDEFKNVIVIGGKAGTLRREVSRLISGLLGNRYGNTGFIFVLLTSELLIKYNNDLMLIEKLLENSDPDFINNCKLILEKVDLSVEPIKYDNKDTADINYLDKRKKIWKNVYGNDEHRDFMYKLSQNNAVINLFNATFKSFFNSKNEYSGFIFRVSDPREFKIPENFSSKYEKFVFLLNAPYNVQNMRTKINIDRFDLVSNRGADFYDAMKDKFDIIDTYDPKENQDIPVWDIAIEILRKIEKETQNPNLRKKINSIFTWAYGDSNSEITSQYPIKTAA